MNIGERMRRLRRLKMLSQGDIEKRTGLLRCYSRVETATTVPSVKTLEKLARALEVPLYQFFYDREGPPEPPIFPWQSSVERHTWTKSAKAVRTLERLGSLLSFMDDRNRRLLFSLAKKMAKDSSTQLTDIKNTPNFSEETTSRSLRSTVARRKGGRDDPKQVPLG
jgi:transcriptional regulator with XRE-family HTH domain